MTEEYFQVLELNCVLTTSDFNSLVIKENKEIYVDPTYVISSFFPTASVLITEKEKIPKCAKIFSLVLSKCRPLNHLILFFFRGNKTTSKLNIVPD